MMWLLHVQLILIELVNISEIYCEMSNPTLSNIIYINNMFFFKKKYFIYYYLEPIDSGL
jgi:hypothetical protein